jgi:hypothetical protein
MFQDEKSRVPSAVAVTSPAGFTSISHEMNRIAHRHCRA